jgi:serine/threonine protein kinase
VVTDLPPASGGLAAGSQIAGYKIEQQIGRGGMAVVYLASDGRLNRSVALKILAPEFADDTSFRQRFIREMRAAAAVDHPNIVPVFDAGEADGALFIAMRYVSGQDLRTLLDHEGTLPAARVAHLISQAASALDEAHSRGLVHRDVKPGNMLIGTMTGSGQPDHLYLSDFGLSKQRTSSPSLTLTGQFLGTLDYMAPEQVEGHDVDGRADLYALACTAFEMLTGQPPFRRDQNFAVMYAQLSAPVPAVTALRPDLPPAVDQVIATALAKSPGDRYQTCTAFAKALRAACGLGRSQAGPAAGLAAPPGPPTERAHIPESGAAAPWPKPLAQPPAPASWSTDALYRPDPPHRPDAQHRPPDARYRPPDAQYRSADARYRPPDAQYRSADARYRPPDAQYRPDVSRLPASQPAAATSWPPAPPPSASPRHPAGRPAARRRRKWPTVVACLVLLGAAGVAFAVLRGRASPPSSPSPAATGKPATGATAGPAATAEAYIAAINAHDYAKAWHLIGGKGTGSSYSSFVNGFNGTAKDKLTVLSVAGNVVTVRLAATQTNGSVKSYQGTYTVVDGVITQSHIQPTG